MNVIKLLKADHTVLAGLFRKVEEAPESEHPAIFFKIKAELDAHAHIEETLFYPKLKAEGAQLKIVATRLGAIPSDNGAAVVADFSFLTAASVLFDAVYLPGGAK